MSARKLRGERIRKCRTRYEITKEQVEAFVTEHFAAWHTTNLRRQPNGGSHNNDMTPRRRSSALLCSTD